MIKGFCLFLLCLLPRVVFAEKAVEKPAITICKRDQIPLSVVQTTGSNGATIAKILRNDLAFSGYFFFSKKSASSYTVSGKITSEGILLGQLVDSFGMCVLSKCYNCAD